MKSPRLKVVADDKIPFLDDVLEPFAEVVRLPGARIGHADLLDADALLTRTRTRCTGELLAGTRVKLIATATIGFDHIDTGALARLGIAWTNAPGCNAASVTEYIGGALTAVGGDLRGKTIGIVGVGNVGKRVAMLAEALGMRVLRNDPPRARMEGGEHFVTLPELVREADFITFHVPLLREGGDRTYHLADTELLRQLKPDCVLLNTSRGEVVDNGALKTMLKERRLRAAVLDVWEHEPEIDLELLSLLALATPHIAGYSTDGKANGTAMSVQALAKFFGIDELRRWRPETLPPPAAPAIRLEENQSVTEQLRAAFAHASGIVRDDRALRENPAAFESLRGNYWVRREPGAFTIHGGSAEARAILARAGFGLTRTDAADSAV